uniref:G-protein coupled receptors family 1 profile domain-containing protein n=1 Tax=Myripristis murdjan TaxID=586833 RepID=A0A667ZJS8_9TELE
MEGSSVTIFITVQKIYYPLLCIMGIPGLCALPCFGLWLLMLEYLLQYTIIYLSCLAIVDTFYLVWVILLDLTLTFWLLQPFWHSHPWCGIMGFLQYGSLYSSSWIVVVFTIERYLVLSSTTNVTLPRCRYRNQTYSTVLVWITTFLSGGIPIVLVIIFNYLIGYHLSRASKLFTKEERRVIRGRSTRGMLRRTFLVLGTVSVAFVVLSLPRFVTYCILRTEYNNEAFDRNDYSIPINVASDLANMLQNLNSTTNFLLYCMVSRRFRQELLQVLTCKAKARELGSFLTHTTMKVFTVTDHKALSARLISYPLFLSKICVMHTEGEIIIGNGP